MAQNFVKGIMEIYLNENRLEITTGDLSNFGQLIQKIERDFLEAGGEVLTQIKLNDQLLDEETEKDNSGLPLDRINVLHLYSATPAALILEALEDAPVILSEMTVVIDEILTAFENAEDSKGYQDFIIITDGLTWYMTIYSKAVVFFSNEITRLKLQDDPFLTESQKLSKTIEDILNCQNSNDRTTFLDLLEYELKPTLGNLAARVTVFRETLANEMSS